LAMQGISSSDSKLAQSSMTRSDGNLHSQICLHLLQKSETKIRYLSNWLTHHTVIKHKN
jgi:hypothetical protein